jgi:hypothetical protein
VGLLPSVLQCFVPLASFGGAGRAPPGVSKMSMSTSSDAAAASTVMRQHNHNSAMIQSRHVPCCQNHNQYARPPAIRLPFCH